MGEQQESYFSYDTGLRLMEIIEKDIGIRDIMLYFGVGLIDKKNGRVGWACCPFHNENTPSFSVDYENNRYYCFGCHEGGYLIEFVKRKLNTDWRGAIRAICNIYNIDIEWKEGTDEKSLIRKMERSISINQDIKRTKDFFDKIVYSINKKIYECSRLKNMGSSDLVELFGFYEALDKEINSEEYNLSVVESMNYSLDNYIFKLRDKLK